jgi:hypothetical protein
VTVPEQVSVSPGKDLATEPQAEPPDVRPAEPVREVVRQHTGGEHAGPEDRGIAGRLCVGVVVVDRVEGTRGARITREVRAVHRFLDRPHRTGRTLPQVLRQRDLTSADRGAAGLVRVVAQRLVHEPDRARDLVPHQPLPEEPQHLAGGDVAVGLDERVHALAEVVVGQPDDDRARDPGVFGQRGFHLDRVDVRAAGDDHVDAAVADVEVAVLVQPPSASRAAAAMTPELAAALEEELATCPSAPTGSSYDAYKALTAHDARLHELILRIAGNTAVEQAFARTHCHLHFFRLSYNQPFGEQTIAEHRALVDALVAGKAAQARKAMTHHLETARNRILSRFD